MSNEPRSYEVTENGYTYLIQEFGERRNSVQLLMGLRRQGTTRPCWKVEQVGRWWGSKAWENAEDALLAILLTQTPAAPVAYTGDTIAL